MSHASDGSRFTIREATTTSDQVAACALQFAVYVGDGYAEAERAATNLKPEVLGSGGTQLIACRPDGSVVGAVLYLHQGSALQQVAAPGEREIRMLGVAREARGEGVGEALVRSCIERARMDNASALVLWTRLNMEAAQRLYARLGFTRITDRDMQDDRGFTRMVYAYIY
ncbi:MAG: GNAT family N-acetyltransferase [Flavobacteriales bacterium]|nr:GNAT family N-acetyltransferase [Flavobacteriales bacterium]